ncbi:MAG: small basic protein [Candidatus Makaraimicrobium thalassicum]|nr:MAG: small basic protein [Candidatus Omnitrophota bacterium]
MTQHPSLKGSQEGGKFRSVLKRYEKIRELVGKAKWDEEKDSVYHLPKVKRIRFKIKKAKEPAEEKEGAALTEEAVAAAPKEKAAPKSAKEATKPKSKKA